MIDSKRTFSLSTVLLVAALLVAPVSGVERTAERGSSAYDSSTPVDLVLALDTSGSMEPLIEGTRIALWDVVNELALAEPSPRLRVALLTYGVKTAGRNGWIRLETDLTENLDLVSERLFSLTSDRGGVEYVGRVLQMALEQLDWSESRDAVKLIFVAGNEPVDQDPHVSFRDMGHLANRAGVSVHTVFCGDATHADAESWKELAELTYGRFASVDPRTLTAVLKTPFDAKLAQLSRGINATYLPLGEEGQARQDLLAAQDKRVMKLSPAAAASRAQAKTSRIYSAGWDLVDAVEAQTVDLYDLDESMLPAKLRNMTLAEREELVGAMSVEREELRQQITALNQQRRQYVAQQLKAKGLDSAPSLDNAMREAIREQAGERGFEFPEP